MCVLPLPLPSPSVPSSSTTITTPQTPTHTPNHQHKNKAYETRILPALRQFRPELLLISTGFDAHADDPLGELELTPEDFHWVTARCVFCCVLCVRVDLMCVYGARGGVLSVCVCMCVHAQAYVDARTNINGQAGGGGEGMRGAGRGVGAGGGVRPKVRERDIHDDDRLT